MSELNEKALDAATEALLSAKTIDCAREVVSAYLSALPPEQTVAVLAERERCAQIAEAASDNSSKADHPYDSGSGSLGYERACDDIAAAIRALDPEPVRNAPPIP